MRVLVTRPAGQAGRLCDRIEAAGHECVRLPTIEIQPAPDPYRLEAIADTLEDYDLAVFVSVNAVQMGLEHILDQRDWPEQTQIATVGARSAEALTAYGLSVDLVPTKKIIEEARKKYKDLLIVGFKVESGVSDKELASRARTKIEAGICDLVVANDEKRKGVAFGTDTNAVLIVGRNDYTKSVDLAPKREIARHIVDEIVNRMK